jgi:four helix bundle protein
MAGGLQELEETAYWFELLVEGGVVPKARLAELRKEADELTAIFVTSINTAKSRHKRNVK